MRPSPAMARVGFPPAMALFLLLLTLPLSVAGAGVPKGGWGSPSLPVSGVIIPGFASSRLRAWALLDCPYSPLDFRPLDPVWLDTTKVPAIPLFCCYSFRYMSVASKSFQLITALSPILLFLDLNFRSETCQVSNLAISSASLIFFLVLFNPLVLRALVM